MSQRMDDIRPFLPDALRRWQVPVEISKLLLEPLMHTPPVLAAQRWWSSEESTLLLRGRVGTGKSVAACWPLTDNFRVLRPFLRVPGDMPTVVQARGALFVPMADLAALSLWDKEDRTFRHRAEVTSLLILDDLGAEAGDGAAIISSLLSSRMAEKQRTIMTTNLDPLDFAQRYGARVFDRIRGSGSIFDAGNESMRGRLMGADKAAGET